MASTNSSPRGEVKSAYFANPDADMLEIDWNLKDQGNLTEIEVP
jgi:hypothetical protein